MENSGRWILVVEDDIDDERLATRVFQQAGRTERLVIARDGEEALGYLKGASTPALVLLDLKLPRLSGMDVLIGIRENERTQSLPVVMLTSSNELSDVAACYGLGCNAFVRKEIDFDRYVSDLAHTLTFWLDVNSVPPDEAPRQREEEVYEPALSQ